MHRTDSLQRSRANVFNLRFLERYGYMPLQKGHGMPRDMSEEYRQRVLKGLQNIWEIISTKFQRCESLLKLSKKERQ